MKPRNLMLEGAMDQADLTRMMAHFDRELLANVERHRIVIGKMAQEPRRTIADEPALIALLGLVAGALFCGTLLVIFEAVGL